MKAVLRLIHQRGQPNSLLCAPQCRAIIAALVRNNQSSSSGLPGAISSSPNTPSRALSSNDARR